MTAERDRARALDLADPLAPMRAAFDLPPNVIYLDGNSLGPPVRGAGARLRQVVEVEWGEGLIRSWNDAGWFRRCEVLGDRLGRLLGAAPGEIVICDSTSINVFKVVTAALQLRPGRRAIVSDGGNFPTDLYMVQGVRSLLPDVTLRLACVDGDLDALIDDSVAAVLLTHVDYRTGAMHDMAAVTRRAHAAGALMLWDLAHSAGAVPVDLAAAGADFAVGCTYKYLNAGPGGPAFVFAARRHQAQARQPLSGWMGHAAPFDFSPLFEADPGIRRFLCGTPPILSLAPLEASLDVWERVDMAAVRRKSLALADLFIDTVEQRAGAAVALVTPRAHAARGSQVSLRHAEAYAVMQALIGRGVIGDFRAPDLLRFGFTPLYISFEEAFDAACALADVLATRAWDTAAFRRRQAVT